MAARQFKVLDIEVFCRRRKSGMDPVNDRYCNCDQLDLLMVIHTLLATVGKRPIAAAHAVTLSVGYAAEAVVVRSKLTVIKLSLVSVHPACRGNTSSFHKVSIRASMQDCLRLLLPCNGSYSGI